MASSGLVSTATVFLDVAVAVSGDFGCCGTVGEEGFECGIFLVEHGPSGIGEVEGELVGNQHEFDEAEHAGASLTGKIPASL